MNCVKLICLAGYLFAAVSLDIFLFTKSAKAFWILNGILLFVALNWIITHPLPWILEWLESSTSGQDQEISEEEPLIKAEEGLVNSDYQTIRQEEMIESRPGRKLQTIQVEANLTLGQKENQVKPQN